ncbi:hypothetical protein Pmani_009089 [Petrolisthes manimaculis]|uniref:Glutathione peroxidase n=1 Tax=Petrolisthes manimaculis TaxID=1843537 RepID=A0AAE1Q5S4_9EUCA|nr:hypothetical protein Pmani_009089 [Petrolisthes manimaculis]
MSSLFLSHTCITHTTPKPHNPSLGRLSFLIKLQLCNSQSLLAVSGGVCVGSFRPYVMAAGSSFYDFSAADIDGNEVSMEKYKDRVCIVVNVASK